MRWQVEVLRRWCLYRYGEDVGSGALFRVLNAGMFLPAVSALAVLVGMTAIAVCVLSIFTVIDYSPFINWVFVDEHFFVFGVLPVLVGEAGLIGWVYTSHRADSVVWSNIVGGLVLLVTVPPLVALWSAVLTGVALLWVVDARRLVRGADPVEVGLWRYFVE